MKETIYTKPLTMPDAPPSRITDSILVEEENDRITSIKKFHNYEWEELLKNVPIDRGNETYRDTLTPQEGDMFVLLADGEDPTLQIWNGTEWTEIKGGGGGLYIGTLADRLALEPYNGLEFNQIEEDGTVHRYFYEKDEWVLLANPDVHDTEEVIITLSDNSGQLDLSDITVHVYNNTTETDHSVDIDSTGEGIIYIPIGESYTVNFPVIEGYFEIDSITNIAERYVRQINARYRIISTGVTYILEKSTNPAVPIDESSDLTAITRILNCESEGNPGSYVIDQQHMAYAKLDPEDHSQFADGTPWSGTYGNAFRHIGKAYLFKDSQYSDGGVKYNISDVRQDDSSIILPESWTGIYKGSLVNNVLVSRPNLTPSASITIQNFWSYANANGSAYGIQDYMVWVKLCHMFAAYYGTRDSQTTIGMGLTKDPAESNQTYYNQLFATTTGYTAGLGDGSGELGNITVNGYTYHQNKLWGIEAPWGQTWDFLQGIRFNGATAYVWSSNEISPSSVGERTFTRNTSLSSTYLNNMVLGNYGDMIGSPNNIAGDSAHGYCDASWSANSENIFRAGGGSSSGLPAGLFASYSVNVFSDSGANSGARTCFYGDINNYTLKTGAELASLNS